VGSKEGVPPNRVNLSFWGTEEEKKENHEKSRIGSVSTGHAKNGVGGRKDKAGWGTSGANIGEGGKGGSTKKTLV